jgi:hypothetical protein
MRWWCLLKRNASFLLSKEVETKLSKRGLAGWGLKRRLGQDLQK